MRVLAPIEARDRHFQIVDGFGSRSYLRGMELAP